MKSSALKVRKISTITVTLFCLGIGSIVSESCISTSLWGQRHKSDEFHLVQTPSGWELALYRYFPDPDTPQRNHPVLICHGISSNKWSWDLEPEHSIAFYLKSKGFEVWMVNLRGADRGTKPSLLKGKTYNFTFDDYVNEDLPAVIDYVTERTGVDAVHWVGHSMGTMVMYAYAGVYKNRKIQSIVSVASPVSFDIPARLWKLVKKYSTVAHGFRFIPSRPAALIAAPLGEVPLQAFDFAIWNPGNLTPRLIRKLMTLAVDNISGGVIQQFAAFIRTGRFLSLDGSVDYLKQMKNITVPILFIAGNLDNLAPPHNIKPAYDAVASQEKRFTVVSEATGFSSDYGHVDLIIGDPAEKDVYPLIDRWLEEHDE